MAQYDALSGFHPDAEARFLERLAAAAVPHELRTHEPPRHARHLAALWQRPLPEAGRATLFYADGGSVLAIVPADRKVSAPRLRLVLGKADLRVLRADRGTGRIGWTNMPEPAGALPGLPGLYDAPGYVDERVTLLPWVIVALLRGRSVSLSPQNLVRITGARVASFTGTTRLLPEGGMEDEGRSGQAPE
jgi:prolyl-tRNA editing enzyme YbaK/EbsC (Cys-tRNA(Pro) deacylase)